jgi:hypothetical protein
MELLYILENLNVRSEVVSKGTRSTQHFPKIRQLFLDSYGRELLDAGQTRFYHTMHLPVKKQYADVHTNSLL